MNKKLKILILAPHTDDGELGCGGSIARFIEEGHEIFYMAFSTAEESIPSGFPKNALEFEVKKATEKLGITADNLFVYQYPVRKLNFYRQDILEELIKMRNNIQFDYVFMPSSLSLHQDHNAIYNEGIRAFKHYACFGYELPWDTINFTTNAFIKLKETHIRKKWEAIEMYETQKFRVYCDEEFIFGLARVRGSQIGVQFAESFELLRIIF